jgi:hypothetical protein
MITLPSTTLSLVAALTLTASGAFPLSANSHGQSLYQAPLPSYYAGRTASLQIRESQPFRQTAGPLQSSNSFGTANVHLLSDASTASDERVEQHSAAQQSEQSAASDSAANDIYDGLPVEGRLERKSASHLRTAPATERRRAIVGVDGDEAQPSRDSVRAKEDPNSILEESANESEEQDEEQDNDDDDGDDECDETGDEDDDDEADELEEHMAVVDRMFNSSIMQNMLNLMNENRELKARLEIQEVEFKAKLRIQAAEFEQREAQQRIHELENEISEREQEQHKSHQRGEVERQQTEEQVERLQRELENRSREMLELSEANQHLEQLADRREQAHQSTIQEVHRNLEIALQNKVELEHRARALEAKIEALQSQHSEPGKAAKRKKALQK